MQVSSLQDLSKFKLGSDTIGKPKWFLWIWHLTNKLFFKTSPQFLYTWRIFLLKLFGAKIGRGVIIRPSVDIIYPWKLSIGDNSWIGDDVVLYCIGAINIGRNVVISQKSYICSGSHDYTKPHFPTFFKPIQIEDECWIATDVFVGPGVTIGKGSVVGARSSVYSDLEKEKVYVGNPAKFIKNRKS